MDRFIYGLFYAETGKDRCFYVGRSINPGRRLRQHGYGANSRHEDVYEFLRDLNAKGVAWHLEILDKVTEADWWPDAERWHVIRLIRDGHELKNMRHGSIHHLIELAKTDPELARQIQSPHIRSAADVRADRQRRDVERTHAKFVKSRQLRRKVLRAALDKALRRGIPDIAACSELATLLPLTYRRLLRIADGKTYAWALGFTLLDILRDARSIKGWLEVAKLRIRNPIPPGTTVSSRLTRSHGIFHADGRIFPALNRDLFKQQVQRRRECN